MSDGRHQTGYKKDGVAGVTRSEPFCGQLKKEL